MPEEEAAVEAVDEVGGVAGDDGLVEEELGAPAEQREVGLREEAQVVAPATLALGLQYGRSSTDQSNSSSERTLCSSSKLQREKRVMNGLRASTQCPG